MRLIDADKLNRDIDEIYSVGNIHCITRELVRKQPTAYDVDKVVEQLIEKQTDAIKMMNDNKGTAYEYPAQVMCDCYRVALEIVKAGGVDE